MLSFDTLSLKIVSIFKLLRTVAELTFDTILLLFTILLLSVAIFRKWVGSFARRKFERFLSDDDEAQLEIIWTYGLHFLPFYLGCDDDNFREVNVLDVKGPDHLKPHILKGREDRTLFSSKIQELELVVGTGNLEPRKTDGVETRKSLVGAVFHQDLVCIIIFLY